MLDSLNTHSVKERIMDAAADIVLEKGASHLTFDALAKKSGLSKGGILYHFANKKALLQAMVQRMIDRFNQQRDRYLKDELSSALPQIRTYILAAHTKDKKSYQADLAVLAAAANDPELLEPLRAHYKDNFLKSRTVPEEMGLATLLQLAMDGIWLLSALGLNFGTQEQIQKSIEQALRLAEDKKL